MSASSPFPRPVGLLGIGLMGQAIAARLRAAGFAVAGYDTQPDCNIALLALGGTTARDAREVFATSETIVLSLPSHAETAALLAAAGSAVRSGATLIDTTTGDPAATEGFAAQLGRQGVNYIDATISGSSAHVLRGEAVVMAGGEAGAYAAAQPILECLGAKVFHTGPAGSGARMKLVTNTVLGLNRAALAEGLVLAEGLGLNVAQALEVMRAGPAYSRMMDTKGEKMLRRDYTPEARLSQHLKDVRLILQLGAAAGLEMPLSRAHRIVLEAAESAGYGAADNSALIEALRPPLRPPAFTP